MKKQIIIGIMTLVSVGIATQSELPKLYPTPEKVKVLMDFPKEGRTGKSGKGFSASLGLLPNGIKKVALASFYAFDPGLTKTWRTSSTNEGYYVSTTTVTTHYKKRSIGGLAPEMAYGALQVSIDPLIKEFGALGMELLLPHQFLDTDAKTKFYNEFKVEHDKGFAGWLQKISSADHEMIYGAADGFNVLDVSKEPFANYTKTGLLSVRQDKVADNQLYIFDKDSRMSESIGYTLCKELGVDAVLVTYFTVFTPSDTKIQLQNVRFLIFGPNPAGPEGESKYGVIPHTKGLFYYGGSVNPEKLIFNSKKKDPETQKYNFTGFENIYTALVRDFGKYYNKSRK